MTALLSIMSGELGDIFWDLPPVVTYVAGLDLGCSIHVANTTDLAKEYALMARLTRGETVISEEALRFLDIHGSRSSRETLSS